MNEPDDSRTICDHDWSEGIDLNYWWCHKCGEYLKKGGPEAMIIYTPWIFEPVSATEK